MLTPRDVAMLIWYALLFSAIVLWASLHGSDDAPNSVRAMPRVAFTLEPTDRTGNLLETHSTPPAASEPANRRIIPAHI
jgi:hypothetical protein